MQYLPGILLIVAFAATWFLLWFWLCQWWKRPRVLPPITPEYYDELELEEFEMRLRTRTGEIPKRRVPRSKPNSDLVHRVTR